MKLKDNNYLKDYKDKMTKIMVETFPNYDEDKIEKIIKGMIEKNVKNPEVNVDNNYTGENMDTSALSILHWLYDKKPIIAGNATFYKNQHQAINPIANMLRNFKAKRKEYKAEMFKIDDTKSVKYADFDLKQLNEKKKTNSYYGASGMKSSAFYSTWSGPATTGGAQSVISTVEQMFEGLLADNYLFINLTELIEWCEKIISPFRDDEVEIDDYLSYKDIYDVIDRLLSKVIQTNDNDKDILYNYLSQFSDKELSVLYYKNNLKEFIYDHEYIQNVILSIFDTVVNLDYVDEKDNEWYSKIPSKYKEDFKCKTAKDWNKFVNVSYFMNPNDPPENIGGDLNILSNNILKYVYCQYLSPDRIYRLKNFKRYVVTVIDTDSNILSMDTIVNFIFDKVVCGESFGRDKMHNEFIVINMLCYVLTNAVTDLLLYYGKASNIPEEFRPIFNMKNEFYFSKLIVGNAKKRYISKVLLREGNLMNPPKKDIKGFDFKKATCSEYAESRFMKIIDKYILECDGIDLRNVLIELNKFRDEIIESIRNGERTFLPNGSAKELSAYKNPESEQSVRGVLAWNMIEEGDQIDLPSKVSLVKLNIFKESDIDDMKDKYPTVYNKIINGIFHDTTGIFVSYSKDGKMDYIDLESAKDDWYLQIPKKRRPKYKKMGKELGIVSWNEFIDKYDGDDKGQEVIEKKVRGLQVLAIPSNEKIPEWAMDYIDYNKMVSDILAPFIPVLEIFNSKQLTVGKTHDGVNRTAKVITPIVKF